eukprot:1251301-Rhodomonas_salina.2
MDANLVTWCPQACNAVTPSTMRYVSTGHGVAGPYGERLRTVRDDGTVQDGDHTPSLREVTPSVPAIAYHARRLIPVPRAHSVRRGRCC